MVQRKFIQLLMGGCISGMAAVGAGYGQPWSVTSPMAGREVTAVRAVRPRLGLTPGLSDLSLGRCVVSGSTQTIASAVV